MAAATAVALAALEVVALAPPALVAGVRGARSIDDVYPRFRRLAYASLVLGLALFVAAGGLLAGHLLSQADLPGPLVAATCLVAAAPAAVPVVTWVRYLGLPDAANE